MGAFHSHNGMKHIRQSVHSENLCVCEISKLEYPTLLATCNNSCGKYWWSFTTERGAKWLLHTWWVDSIHTIEWNTFFLCILYRIYYAVLAIIRNCYGKSTFLINAYLVVSLHCWCGIKVGPNHCYLGRGLQGKCPYSPHTQTDKEQHLLHCLLHSHLPWSVHLHVCPLALVVVVD